MDHQTDTDTFARLLDETLVSVIIPVRNESATLSRVLREARKISKRTEMIVVCNGCTDNSEEIARKEGAMVIRTQRSLGYDVGRAVGAKYATGEMAVFIDSDFRISAKKIRPLCMQVLLGSDVVLNGYDGYRNKRMIHSTSQAKRLLNKWLDREELGGSSLTTVPHVLSRKALNTIGYHELAVPPKAFVKAALNGLIITKSKRINTSKRNKRKKRKRARTRRIKKLILGDHLEALASLVEAKGNRLHFIDKTRYRNLVRDYMNKTNIPNRSTSHRTNIQQNARVSVIIPVCNEQETIATLLENVLSMHPSEVIVVENGSTDRTREICQSYPVTCLTYNHCLGHDVGRAIGAAEATGDILLFIDGDMVLRAEEMRPFIERCKTDADIALNNVNPYYTDSNMIDYVSMAKALLNRALLLPRLKYSSLTAVPHAMTKHAAERIGYVNLMVPPKAQLIAAICGLRIVQIPGPNVLHQNRVKPSNSTKNNEVEALILGDHLEAIHYAQAILGNRLHLVDRIRKRQFIDASFEREGGGG